jgi:hypothetical protein
MIAHMFDAGNRVMTAGLDRFTGMNDVTATLSLQMLDGAEPVTGTFRYTPSDPWALSATFASPTAGSVTWTFARDLLVQGQYEPVGDGDVHVWPCLSAEATAVVVIELDPDQHGVLLEASAREMHAFIEATLACVPLGRESEHVDLDAGLAKLLTPRGTRA